MPEFELRGKKFSCPNSIYYPSEDSYLLAENVSIQKDAECIDLGCGSGIQAMNMLLQGAAKVTAIDIDKECLEATVKNADSMGMKKKIITLQSDLFSEFSGTADAIVFNPPYVFTEDIRYRELDGGKNGREVLDRFLEQFPKHLKHKGKCFFIQTSINGYPATNIKLENAGLKFSIKAKRGGFFEELAVYECTKK